MPAYANELLPRSVVSRPLKGQAPTIDVAVGYQRTNSSPVLKLFLSRLGAMTDTAQARRVRVWCPEGSSRNASWNRASASAVAR
ncbi:MAG: LysR family transcriptional regulator, hca operon transcriptional activator [Mycobacterium sp.]|nr:LysR family transcriptional regulator, hca operon transcriptional activator [Mycobacterium sp.]